MSIAPELDCGLCRLRPWRKTDRESLVRHANNRRVWRNLRDRFPHPYDEANATGWLAVAGEVPPPPGVWAIEVGGEAVGGLGLERLADVERHTAEIGYWLAEPLWGRGIATAAVRCAADHALEQPDLWRLVAAVFAWNAASMRVLEKAGFKLEAVLRCSAFKDGTVLDQVVYARTRDPGLPYVRYDHVSQR
jgi:RimJ/RimL family protein N-acetyltransferase